ncbi:hypothetical protein CRYUN_Cryun25bG0044500 [Craigia yunnanensis]
MDEEDVGLHTLDEALESVGFGKFQGLVLAYAGLGLFAEAMEIMILSFIGAAVKTEWELSSGQESLLTTVVFAEFVPASNRGIWMVIYSTFWTFGSIFEASLAWIVMPRLNWRWLLAFSSVPSFALLLLYGVAPESPRYLCMKGSTSDALQILEKIASVNQTKLPPGILVSGRTSARMKKLPGLLLSAILVDRVGRKLSMAFMFVLAFIFLLPLLTHQSAFLTTCLLFGAHMCASGTFTVACIFSP